MLAPEAKLTMMSVSTGIGVVVSSLGIIGLRISGSGGGAAVVRLRCCGSRGDGLGTIGGALDRRAWHLRQRRRRDDSAGSCDDSSVTIAQSNSASTKTRTRECLHGI